MDRQRHLAIALLAEPLRRSAFLAEYGIREYGDAVELYKTRGVPQPCHTDAITWWSVDLVDGGFQDWEGFVEFLVLYDNKNEKNTMLFQFEFNVILRL